MNHHFSSLIRMLCVVVYKNVHMAYIHNQSFYHAHSPLVGCRCYSSDYSSVDCI